jgi:hypothetical protein
MVIAGVTGILGLVLAIMTKSKILVTVLITISFSVLGLGIYLVGIAQKTVNKLGEWSGWYDTVNIQGGFGAVVFVVLTIYLGVKTKSHILLCFMVIVSLNLLTIDQNLVQMANLIGDAVNGSMK